MNQTVHPEFKKALDLGHVEPVILPNGKPFIVDGRQFYQAADGGVSMYQGRMMAFTDVIEKHDRLKLDETTLRAFFASVTESATQATLLMTTNPEGAVQYLSDLVMLGNFGKQRLDLYENVSELGIGSNTGRVYELSSIYFFASDEDPAAYDPIKGKRNVESWLPHANLYDFFFAAAVKPICALSRALPRKYPEVYPGDSGLRSTGIAPIHKNPLAAQNEWGKSHFDTLFRVADGDPTRLQFLLRSTVEASHDYMAAYIRKQQHDLDQQRLAAESANRTHT